MEEVVGQKLSLEAPGDLTSTDLNKPNVVNLIINRSLPKVVPGILLQTIRQIDEDSIYGKNLAKRVLEKANANPVIIRKQTIKQEREGNGETIEFHPYNRTELQEL